MSNKINIDELLKQELGNLAPEPPAGVWESVGQQVQAVQQAAQVTGSVASAGKTALISSKIIITATAVAVTSVAAYFGLKSLMSEEKPVTTQAVQQQAPVLPETGEIAGAVKEEHSEANEKDELKEDVSQASAGYKTSNKRVVPASKQAEKRMVPPPVSFPEQHDKVMDRTDPLIINEREGKPQGEEGTQSPVIPIADQAPIQAESNEQAAVQEFQSPFIPNVFTPNIDGKNDEFEIMLENEILYDLKITDRKGNIVFESRDKNKHWQGIDMYTGKACDEGMYIYAFKYQVTGMKEAQTLSGWINLRRTARQ